MQGFRPATLLKSDSQHRCFPVKLCEIFKNAYLEKHLRTAASKHRSSFLEVFCRNCCSALIIAVMKYSFSAAVVQSWRVFHGNLLKIPLHYRYFSKNFTTIAEQRYWKMYLDGWFWGRIHLGNILHGCFSKVAANVYSF